MVSPVEGELTPSLLNITHLENVATYIQDHNNEESPLQDI